MSQDNLEDALTLAIRYALQQHKYARPKTPDNDIRDRYFSEAAKAIVKHLKLNWRLEPPNVIRRKPPNRRIQRRGRSDADHRERICTSKKPAKVALASKLDNL